MDLRNVYNTAESDTSTCYCRDIIQDVFDLIKKLLSLEDSFQWKMFKEIKSKNLWYSNIILAADHYYLRRTCSLSPPGLPNTALEYKRLGIPLSTLLFNLLSVLYFKSCRNLCCCLDFDNTTYFASADFEIIGVIGALHGKTEFMQVLVNYGYISSLPDTSPLLEKETDEIMLNFIGTVSDFADIYLPTIYEVIMKLLRITFFRGKEIEAIYKRKFLVACALRAVQHSLRNKHVYAEKLIKCLRLYFSVTSDLYISSFEVRCVLYSCFIVLDKLDLFEQYAQEFDKLMPECPARPKPHTLTHLIRCQVRKNLRISKLPLPSAVDKLVLPKILKNFIVGKDLPGKSGNISLQKAITKSELAGLICRKL